MHECIKLMCLCSVVKHSHLNAGKSAQKSELMESVFNIDLLESKQLYSKFG